MTERVSLNDRQKQAYYNQLKKIQGVAEEEIKRIEAGEDIEGRPCGKIDDLPAGGENAITVIAASISLDAVGNRRSEFLTTVLASGPNTDAIWALTKVDHHSPALDDSRYPK